MRWWIAIVAEVVAPFQLLGDLGHDLLGHAFVGLVVEVRDRPGRGSESRVVPMNVATAPASSEATSSIAASTESGSSLRTNAPPDTGGISATSSPSASSWPRSTYDLFTA